MAKGKYIYLVNNYQHRIKKKKKMVNNNEKANLQIARVAYFGFSITDKKKRKKKPV